MGHGALVEPGPVAHAVHLEEAAASLHCGDARDLVEEGLSGSGTTIGDQEDTEEVGGARGNVRAECGGPRVIVCASPGAEGAHVGLQRQHGFGSGKAVRTTAAENDIAELVRGGVELPQVDVHVLVVDELGRAQRSHLMWKCVQSALEEVFGLVLEALRPAAAPHRRGPGRVHNEDHFVRSCTGRNAWHDGGDAHLDQGCIQRSSGGAAVSDPTHSVHAREHAFEFTTGTQHDLSGHGARTWA
mmetsp:Transcript_21501/g.57815  ORF Transcript_21501/g.57815 Transcript_21501/m.57815 type:complete len:243 (-) Transcript_21501:1384-2112(-)